MFPDTKIRRSLNDAFAKWVAKWRFREIETPILEEFGLYQSLGGGVGKEIYRIDGASLVLRPEGTAGVVRANAADRVWYSGPMFRHERPQRGRYRQFWQMGVECFEDDVYADAEVVGMGYGYLRECGWGGVLRINSLGGKEDRVRYNEVLKEYLDGKVLSENSRRRVERGDCLRVLDSKEAVDREVIRECPRIWEFISADERERFEQLKDLLREDQVEFTVDELLVRGLDYYTSTTFEYDGVGKAVGGGGRYDIGGRGGGGIGFAIGVDRLEQYQRQKVEERDGVFIVGLDGGGSSSGRLARKLGAQLRQNGHNVRICYTKHSNGMRKAAVSNGKYAVMVGTDEVCSGKMGVKKINCTADTRCPAITMAPHEVVDYLKADIAAETAR